ncbi:MAG TPA: glycosyltransferase [Hanamia sp.]|nr:glycosyltransferase [Hanamia sp.]
MKNKIHISCLPVAGIENPYQFLMMQGLQTDKRLLVRNGINDRFFGILKTAIKQKPDYIHFDWETSYYYRRSLWMTLINVPFFIIQVYIARYIFNCKLVWTPHNIIPHDSKYLRIHKFCRNFFAHNMKWIRLFSEASLEGASRELKCENSKFKIIPEGSYVDYYTNQMNSCEARKLLGIEKDKLVLLYIGLIKPYKGVAELITCFKSSFSGNAILIIAGKVMDADYGVIIKELANEENLILIDRFIEKDELQIYFNAADVVTLPFKQIENSGSAILAMGFKKAVIAPKMGVLTERLRNQTELLYEESMEESFTVLKGMTSTKLLEIGENNFSELAKYKWCDFAKAF